jgi:hypothetical protein
MCGIKVEVDDTGEGGGKRLCAGGGVVCSPVLCSCSTAQLRAYADSYGAVIASVRALEGTQAASAALCPATLPSTSKNQDALMLYACCIF